MQLTNEDIVFLQTLQARVRAKPELVAHVVNYMTAGIQEAVSQQMNRATDMETIASMAIHTRLFKGNEKFIASKIRNYYDKKQTSLEWNHVLERLEK